MNWWERLAEERIRRALAEGEFDDLPAGVPLPEDDFPPGLPEEWRLAWKILRNNDLLPPWLAKRRALQADIAAWKEAVAHARPADRPRLRAEMTALNRRIRDYNLEAPHPIWHLLPLHWPT